MKAYAERLKPLYPFAEKILFPVILVLFPLLKVNQGIDLTDTAYSLGNYAFFGENTVLWTLLTFFCPMPLDFSLRSFRSEEPCLA